MIDFSIYESEGLEFPSTAVRASESFRAHRLGHAALTEDTTRVMGWLKALYRSQAISSAGKEPYGQRHRGEWLAQLTQAGMHRRAERLYQELL